GFSTYSFCQRRSSRTTKNVRPVARYDRVLAVACLLAGIGSVAQSIQTRLKRDANPMQTRSRSRLHRVCIGFASRFDGTKKSFGPRSKTRAAWPLFSRVRRQPSSQGAADTLLTRS